VNAARDRFGPTLALLYAASFWGVVWYPTRVFEELGIQGAWLTLVAYAAALLVFVPFARLSFARMRYRPTDTLVLLLAAGWANVAFLLAVIDGEVVRVVLLFYLSPIWTVLFGRWLLGEAWSRHTWLMLGLGMGGALTMLWDPRLSQSPLSRSDLLAVSAGFAFAINNVMTRRITHLGVSEKTCVAWLGALAVSAVLLSIGPAPLPQVAAQAWLGVVALGVFGFLLSTLTVVYGVSHMPVQRSAVIMLFELIVGAVTAWWWAGEAISAQEWIGGMLILSAAMIAIFRQEPTQ